MTLIHDALDAAIRSTKTMSAFQLMGAFVGLSVIGFVKWYIYNLQFSGIPTVGYSNPLLSWITAIRYVTNCEEMMREGYDKYKPGVFKIATINGWLVVAAGPQYVDDVRKAPDEVLNFKEAMDVKLQADHMFGPGISGGYHVGIVRSQLTRNLAVLFDDIRDEVAAAFNDAVPVKDDGEWITVRTQPMLQSVISRVSNRLFVGLPLCRNQEWVNLNIEFAIDAIVGANILRFFPGFLKPIASTLFTRTPQSHKRGMALVGPVIEQRQRMMAEYGDEWPSRRPNDFLQWLMDAEEGQGQPADEYCKHLMAVNFAAIHTSSMNMSQALYHLAPHPEWQQELREEVQDVVREHGWSKMSMAKMVKIDSFLREQQRYEGTGILSVERLVLRPFTFSNGVHVPKGAIITCVQNRMHRDEDNYVDAETFNPWRFSHMREGEGEGTASKYLLVTPGNDFISFGNGRHACPGRFFAANELKCMLAHIVLNYDVAFAQPDASYPHSRSISGMLLMEDMDIVFRKIVS